MRWRLPSACLVLVAGVFARPALAADGPPIAVLDFNTKGLTARRSVSSSRRRARRPAHRSTGQFR